MPLFATTLFQDSTKIVPKTAELLMFESDPGRKNVVLLVASDIDNLINLLILAETGTELFCLL
jgi:hypothetical protein